MVESFGKSSNRKSPEIDQSVIEAVTEFIRTLPVRHAQTVDTTRVGFIHFKSLLCDQCHIPSFNINGKVYMLFTDLLLHDLGPSLNDRFVQGLASGAEWRTTPLHGLHTRKLLLHDGRAKTIHEAILAHQGEAIEARTRYLQLSELQREDLILFLRQL